MPDGTIVVHSDTLLLVSDGENEIEPDKYKIIASVTRFLNALRVICGQPKIPLSISMFTLPVQIDRLVLPEDLPTLTTGGAIQKHILFSATTFDHLRHASDAIVNDAVSVHGEMINDAAEAAMSSNYRSAIIFSAAAVESCAGSILDAEYERQLNLSDHGPERRYITIQVNRNESVTKDPIYLALRSGTGEGGSRFLKLLHECPLYLLGRSLLVTDAKLYSKAHSLYRTRNCLAHTGIVDSEKENLLTVDNDGAMDAIDVANNVLQWFGETGTIKPNSGFVRIADDDIAE
ncbi:MAG: hypothetical protein O7G85_03140 [Planctomycetota bacterium]|nr:hypothetical protein [Planctomycetota bacterium]